jgi:hypothetical protein
MGQRILARGKKMKNSRLWLGPIFQENITFVEMRSQLQLQLSLLLLVPCINMSAMHTKMRRPMNHHFKNFSFVKYFSFDPQIASISSGFLALGRKRLHNLWK